MSIFDTLKDLIEVKSGEALNDFDSYQEFQPYVTCRWLSMYGEEYSQIINHTVNELYPGIESKEMWYKLLTTIIPASKYRFVKYIKKPKKEKKQLESEKLVVDVLSRNLEMSRREIIQMLEQHSIDRSMFKELK